jgi:hypothetical protein
MFVTLVDEGTVRNISGTPKVRKMAGKGNKKKELRNYYYNISLKFTEKNCFPCTSLENKFS